MPIEWRLKKWLAVERDIYRPIELKELLAEKAGVYLSSQAVSALMNATPNALRLQTIQALCTALDCKLSDFCEVLPETGQDQKKQRKVVGGEPTRLYGNKTASSSTNEEETVFPSPRTFMHKAEGQQKGTSEETKTDE